MKLRSPAVSTSWWLSGKSSQQLVPRWLVRVPPCHRKLSLLRLYSLILLKVFPPEPVCTAAFVGDTELGYWYPVAFSALLIGHYVVISHIAKKHMHLLILFSVRDNKALTNRALTNTFSGELPGSCDTMLCMFGQYFTFKDPAKE